MSTRLRTWSAALLAGFPRAAGAAAAAAGGLVLAGWALGAPALQGAPAGVAAVPFSTAVFLLLAGPALVLVSRGEPGSARRRVGRSLAAAGCLLAALALLEHASPTGSDLDLLPFARLGFVSGQPAHDRVPFGGAVLSLMAGGALLLLDTRRAHWLAELLAAFTAFLCLLDIPWQVYLLALPTPRPVTPQSPLPAAAYLALGLGTLAARPDRGWVAVVAGPGLGGVLARRLLPVAVLAPSLLWWAWMLAMGAGLINPAVGGVLYFVANMAVFSAMVLWAAAVLNRLDATRRRAEEGLREADRRKDEFLAMLAHELRNPLAPIRNGLHILRRPEADRQSADAARQMLERQVGHLSRIVDDLLDVSRVQRGKVSLRPERLDLARLAREVAEDHRAAFGAAGVALELDAPDTPVWVEGDPTRLTQVLGNLLQNAVKFTDRGGRVAVRVSAEAGRAVLSVRDTGAGISPELLPRLFEPFAQSDRSLDRSQGGLGLGLALAKGLVELHGGEVRAASAGPGRGAEFTVRLPLRPEPPALAAAPAAPAPAQARLRILVVEDNRDAADSLRMLLELFGHEVTVAYTGPQGVAAAAEWRPDVVLCDIGLPGLNGYGVVGELRRNPATAQARMIAVTGYGAEEDRRRSEEAGFDAHLVKPADPDALGELLARPGPAA